MLDTQFNGPPRRSNTIADEVSAPCNATSIGVASTSQLNANTPAVMSNFFFPQWTLFTKLRDLIAVIESNIKRIKNDAFRCGWANNLYYPRGFL